MSPVRGKCGEDMVMDRNSAFGIVALVVGILVLVVPSFLQIVVGVVLIIVGTLALTGSKRFL